MPKSPSCGVLRAWASLEAEHRGGLKGVSAVTAKVTSAGTVRVPEGQGLGKSDRGPLCCHTQWDGKGRRCGDLRDVTRSAPAPVRRWPGLRRRAEWDSEEAETPAGNLQPQKRSLSPTGNQPQSQKASGLETLRACTMRTVAAGGTWPVAPLLRCLGPCASFLGAMTPRRCRARQCPWGTLYEGLGLGVELELR